MGMDAGFDMSPPLELRDQETWERFIDEVISVYKNDKIVVVSEKRVTFKVGMYLFSFYF